MTHQPCRVVQIAPLRHRFIHHRLALQRAGYHRLQAVGRGQLPADIPTVHAQQAALHKNRQLAPQSAPRGVVGGQLALPEQRGPLGKEGSWEAAQRHQSLLLRLGQMVEAAAEGRGEGDMVGRHARAAGGRQFLIPIRQKILRLDLGAEVPLGGQ